MPASTRPSSRSSTAGIGHTKFGSAKSLSQNGKGLGGSVALGHRKSQAIPTAASTTASGIMHPGSNATLYGLAGSETFARKDATMQTEESALRTGREMAETLVTLQKDLVQTKQVLQTHYEATLQKQTQQIVQQLQARWQETEKEHDKDLHRVRGALRQEEANHLAVLTNSMQQAQEKAMQALQAKMEEHEKEMHEKLKQYKQDAYHEGRRAEKWRYTAEKLGRAAKLMTTRIRDKAFIASLELETVEADHDLIDHLTATITTKDEQIAALTKKVEDFESRRDALLAARGRPGSARSVSKSISNGNNTGGVQHVSRPGSRQASSNFTTSVVAMPSESAYALPHQAVIVEEEAAPEPTPLGGGGQYTQQEMDEALAIMDAEWSEKAEMMEKEKEMEIVRLRKDLLRMKKDYAERIQGMKESFNAVASPEAAERILARQENVLKYAQIYFGQKAKPVQHSSTRVSVEGKVATIDLPSRSRSDSAASVQLQRLASTKSVSSVPPSLSRQTSQHVEQIQ